jgi:hypothetical protein
MMSGQKRIDENTYFNFAFNFSEQRATLEHLFLSHIYHMKGKKFV